MHPSQLQSTMHYLQLRITTLQQPVMVLGIYDIDEKFVLAVKKDFHQPNYCVPHHGKCWFCEAIIPVYI